jgi:hypothetical protein
MNKRQLIALVEGIDCPDETEVLLSSDAEGNVLSFIDEISYEDDTETEVYEVINKPFIVLWPV